MDPLTRLVRTKLLHPRSLAVAVLLLLVLRSWPGGEEAGGEESFHSVGKSSATEHRSTTSFSSGARSRSSSQGGSGLEERVDQEEGTDQEEGADQEIMLSTRTSEHGPPLVKNQSVLNTEVGTCLVSTSLPRTHNDEQPKRRVGQKSKVGRILEARVGRFWSKLRG